MTKRQTGLLDGIWGLSGEPAGVRYSTYELTQLVFTPVDLNNSQSEPADRPYAGVLYAGLMTHLKSEQRL